MCARDPFCHLTSRWVLLDLYSNPYADEGMEWSPGQSGGIAIISPSKKMIDLSFY
jgi:hypothetical protein